MGYNIEKANGQVWGEDGWTEAGSIYAVDFELDDLIVFDDGAGCNVQSYFDNSCGDAINIGWADDDNEILAQVIESK